MPFDRPHRYSVERLYFISKWWIKRTKTAATATKEQQKRSHTKQREHKSFIATMSPSCTVFKFSCLWNQLPLSLRQPHSISGTNSSFSYSLIFTHHFYLSCVTTLLSSFILASKPTCFTNPTPVVSLLPAGLPSRTIARTVSSELLGVCF